MIKSDALMRLEKEMLFYQMHDGPDKGKWLNGYKGNVDLTPYLLKAGMFEQ